MLLVFMNVLLREAGDSTRTRPLRKPTHVARMGIFPEEDVMRWTSGGRSANLEDRRAETGGSMVRGGGIGCGTLLILIVLSVIFKQDFLSLLGPALMTDETGAPAPSTEGELVTTPEEERLVDFMSFVLDDLQGTREQGPSRARAG